MSIRMGQRFACEPVFLHTSEYNTITHFFLEPLPIKMLPEKRETRLLLMLSRDARTYPGLYFTQYF